MRLYELPFYNPDRSKLPRTRKLGNWTITVEQDLDPTLTFHQIRHYGTQMLTWNSMPTNPRDVVSASGWLGWGSVSDQNGMNEFLLTLSIPVYFSRKGGAHFIGTTEALETGELSIASVSFSYYPLRSPYNVQLP